MKKYLLGLLAIPFLFVGFSDASSKTLTWSNGQYSPSHFTLYQDISKQDLISDWSCEGDSNCYFVLGDCGIHKYFSILGYSDCPDTFEAGTYYPTVYEGDRGFDSITINLGENPNPGGGSSDSTLLPDGTDTLTPVIEGLSDTITEFGPYLIYIALGILGCVVGFFAIKRLMNWIRAKILSMFK